MELKELAHNLKITGYISKEKLLEYYQNAKVYAQLSYYESFGVSLAEAMACSCIPVVAKRAALPEVAGNIGYYVNYDDVKEIVKAVRQALEDGPDVGRKARKRIKDEFSLEKRRIALNTAVGD
jgi:glycosyltransferase involved in cell wall biosynthesis